MILQLNPFFFQVFLASPDLQLLQFLGTAFPVAPNGGLMTCRHVTDVNKEENELVAIFDGERNQVVLVKDIQYPQNPRLDIAYMPNALGRPKREFFPILNPAQIAMGQDVYSVGFYVAGESPEVGYFKGNIVNLTQSEKTAESTEVSLSYPVIEGLSGSPVLTYHNGPKVVGLCHGSVQSRIAPREILEYEDGRLKLQETVTRIVELGRAYHASALMRFLDEVDAEGYVVSSEHVSGIFES